MSDPLEMTLPKVLGRVKSGTTTCRDADLIAKWLMPSMVVRLTNDVLGEVAAERARQDQLYGLQTHDQLRWLSIEMEELGEVARAIYEHWHNEADLAQARHEWLHVAAVAVAAIESLDRHVEKT